MGYEIHDRLRAWLSYLSWSGTVVGWATRWCSAALRRAGQCRGG